ncbi:hypothetical protein LDB30_12970 [Acidithiobacillus ferrooxidans]|uniref:hypothetical protein n=1 Tax=Acidithiobacillus ferrooxidans TaxID=920 RepID=UPI001CDCB478|nr:hypothetical protein [Acidithiobacillus ferrooxidans]UBU61977.1 hypothetical protein LDB30_12970 [Acidithiobacillus ferrooxidans]
MIRRLSAGMSLALSTLFLPNALAPNLPDLPAPFLGTPIGSIGDPLKPGDSLDGTTNAQPVAGFTQAQGASDGTLLMHHGFFYLRRVTAYNALADQTNSNPDISACGPNRPDQVALSQDLFFRKNGGNRCGERINIILRSGRVIHGVVWDTMNPRYHMAADILMGSVQHAVDFGVKQAKLRFVHSMAPVTNGI